MNPNLTLKIPGMCHRNTFPLPNGTPVRFKYIMTVEGDYTSVVFTKIHIEGCSEFGNLNSNCFNDGRWVNQCIIGYYRVSLEKKYLTLDIEYIATTGDRIMPPIAFTSIEVKLETFPG
jgi:hypothetical protein